MARRDVPMSIKRLVVDIDPSGLNVTQFCSEHRISTWFFWDLRRRFVSEGDAAFVPKSRAPKRVANKTPVGIEEAIVAKRKELTDAGLDAGADSIWWHLRDLEGRPSRSTIYRILRSRGFITAQPAKAPKRSGRRFNAERANESWQLDDTDWQLADETAVKILNILDDHSRLLTASTAMATCTGAATLNTMATTAAVLGWPARFQSDNAKAFQEVLAKALSPLGIASARSRPHHPQTNGKIERFHQTLKRWLAKQPRAESLAELQEQLDAFRHLYNHHRPHRALNRATPATVWTHAPKTGPSNQPLGAPSTIHHSTVINGRCRAGTNLITLGAAYNTKAALTIITGTACHVFIDGKLIRHLTLDPTHEIQALHNRPGRPRIQ